MLGAALSGYLARGGWEGDSCVPRARVCDRGAGWTVFIGIGTNDAHFSLLYMILYDLVDADNPRGLQIVVPAKVVKED